MTLNREYIPILFEDIHNRTWWHTAKRFSSRLKRNETDVSWSIAISQLYNYSNAMFHFYHLHYTSCSKDNTYLYRLGCITHHFSSKKWLRDLYSILAESHICTIYNLYSNIIMHFWPCHEWTQDASRRNRKSICTIICQLHNRYNKRLPNLYDRTSVLAVNSFQTK